MVSVASKPASRNLSEADRAVIYELLSSAPRTAAEIARALQVDQAYIEQHLSFEALTGVIALVDGAYSTWRTDLK